MSDMNTGGPAFPGMRSEAFGQDSGHQEGMTLRDYYAGQAMGEMIARWQEGHPNGWDGLAAASFQMADAMLKARQS